MTQRLFKNLSLLFIGSILFSCSLEDEYVTKQQYQQSSKYSIERKSLKELLQDQKFSTAFNKLPKQNVYITTSVVGRTVMEQDYGFTISENIPAQVMSTEYLTSYTFYISRSTPSIDFFENLVVQTDTLGTTKAYIVKYSLNTPVSYFAEHDSYIVDGQRELTSILYNANEANAKIQYVGDDDCTLYTLMCPYGHPHPASLVCIGEGQDVYWVSDNSNCAGSGNNSGDGGSTGDSGASNPGSDSGTGGSGNTGGTTGGEENNDGLVDPGTCKGCGGVVTVPLPELEEVVDPTDPCSKLKDLFNVPITPSLKDIIKNHLETDIAINPNGEKGAVINKDASGNYSRAILPPTSTNLIGIPTATAIPGLYTAIHSHPNSTYPMFSWSDIYVLHSINSDIDSYNEGLATFLLTCDLDGTGNYQTYAIIFNSSTADIVDMILNNPFNNGMTKKQIAASMDAELEQKFITEDKNGTKNYERAFLEQILNTNVSLYKANSALDNWGRLELNQTSNNVQNIPCN